MAMNATWPDDWDDGLRKAVGAVRSVTKFALDLGVSRGMVYRWKQIPAELVVKAEQTTGVPREELRPDLFRRQAAPQESGAES